MIVNNIPSFITTEEATLVRTLLDEDFDKFEPLSTPGFEICLDRKIIGEGIYAIPYDQDINADIKKYMYNRYYFLYLKVFEFLKNIYERPVVFKDDLPIPGFHYLKRNFKIDNPWHRDDSITGRKGFEDLNQHNVHSFLISINMPKNGHIEFKQTEGYQFKTSEDGDTHKHYHEDRSLVTWPGMVWHRLGNSYFDNLDPRITFQGHYHLGKEEIFMFF